MVSKRTGKTHGRFKVRDNTPLKRKAQWWKHGHQRSNQGFPRRTSGNSLFLPNMYPNVNANKDCVSVEKPPDIHQPIHVKHPDAHQLACTVNDDDGLVEIKQGKYVTTLAVPPGPISIKYSTKN